MSGAGNPLGYDYRDPRHVERYGKLVVRNPDGSTEGKHPRDADVDVMREIHEPAPLLRVIRAKCIDCSGGSESEARKCTAIGCALWPYRMGWNPFRAPREVTPEQREAGQPAWPLQGRVVGRPQKGWLPALRGGAGCCSMTKKPSEPSEPTSWNVHKAVKKAVRLGTVEGARQKQRY